MQQQTQESRLAGELHVIVNGNWGRCNLHIWIWRWGNGLVLLYGGKWEVGEMVNTTGTKQNQHNIVSVIGASPRKHTKCVNTVISGKHPMFFILSSQFVEIMICASKMSSTHLKCSRGYN
jgi:hypothetical protein